MMVISTRFSRAPIIVGINTDKHYAASQAKKVLIMFLPEAYLWLSVYQKMIWSHFQGSCKKWKYNESLPLSLYACVATDICTVKL